MQDLGINVLFQGTNFWRLLMGLWVTIRIALIAMSLSLLFGTVFGMIMTIKNKWIQALCGIYLEFIRIMPQLVLLFLVYFGAAKHLDFHVSGEAAALIVFTFWGTAEMGDLIRNAIISLPIHQRQSGLGLGMTSSQVFFSVLLPQTVRGLLPSIVNLLTRMVKTTSLVILIGVVEVVKVGKQIIDASRYTEPRAALWVYGAIFMLYFLVCYPFSKWASYLERKWQED